VPVDSVESLALGPTDPRMNSGLTDIEFVNDLVMRATASDSGNDGSSASGFPFTLAHGGLQEGMRYFSPDSTGLIGMRWHKK
jgi:hypothetical protein